MTCFVDTFGAHVAKRWQGGGHLIADSFEELQAMAERLRLKPWWFQATPYPHFDLTRAKRAQAIRCGTVELSPRELVAKLDARRREQGQ